MAIRAEDLRRLQASFDWAAWQRRIHDALHGPMLSIAIDQGDRSAEEYELDFNPDDPAYAAWADEYLAGRVTQIDETTRERLGNALADAFRDGDSIEDVVAAVLDAVDGAYVFSSARALTIAQTEAATAYNVGSALVFRANGIEELDIFDGDEFDDECAAANGDVWTVDEFLDNPLEHPNCARWAMPHLADDTED